ncbi:MAG TPA: DUF1007 family protein [Arenibaculum sp.]|nr:DUF1007 family protein [Arenibaculum sp.]
MPFRSFRPLALLLVPLAGLLAPLLAPLNAHAHPHVWIDTRTTARFGPDRHITALDVRWHFDEIYGAYATEGLDADGDGHYAAEELAPLAAENVAQLREWGYFTVLKADGARIGLGPVSQYAMTYEKGRLTLAMTLPLARPVDPRRSSVTFSSFDPSFYIELVPAKEDAVTLEGAGTGDCTAHLERFDADQPAFVPDAVADAAELDPADPESGVGARFAEWITISCSGQS